MFKRHLNATFPAMILKHYCLEEVNLLLSLLLTSTFCFALGDGVTVDKEKCTITKKGKTFPLYGEIHLMESEGLADLVVYVKKVGAILIWTCTYPKTILMLTSAVDFIS